MSTVCVYVLPVLNDVPSVKDSEEQNDADSIYPRLQLVVHPKKMEVPVETTVAEFAELVGVEVRNLWLETEGAVHGRPTPEQADQPITAVFRNEINGASDASGAPCLQVGVGDQRWKRYWGGSSLIPYHIRLVDEDGGWDGVHSSKLALPPRTPIDQVADMLGIPVSEIWLRHVVRPGRPTVARIAFDKILYISEAAVNDPLAWSQHKDFEDTCPLCTFPFDNDKHAPYVTCKAGHCVCERCVDAYSTWHNELHPDTDTPFHGCLMGCPRAETPAYPKFMWDTEVLKDGKVTTLHKGSRRRVLRFM